MMSHVMRTGAELTAAVPADFDAVVKVFGQGQYFAEQMATSGPTGNQVYLARSGEDLLGTVTIGPLGDEEDELKESFPPSETRLLTHLEVPPALRNQGIGRAIMAEVEGVVRQQGFSRIVLGVDLDNEGAERLYRHLGYRLWRDDPLRTKKRHYRDDGSTWHAPDECRVFYKDLGAAGDTPLEPGGIRVSALQ